MQTTAMLHTRAEWASRHPNMPAAKKGVGTIVLHHTDGSASTANIPGTLRGLEAMVTGGNAPGNSSPLIALDYNLLVAVDGSIWEGRGLAAEDAATLHFNGQSVSIAAMGDFDTHEPPQALLLGVAEACRMAIAGGWTVPNPAVIGHRDVGTFATACPGRFLEAQIQNIRQVVFSTALPPAQNTPPPVQGDEEMYRLLKGDAKGAAGDQYWFTNWLTKRKVGTPAEAQAILESGATQGAKVIPWPQAWVDNIPVVK